VSFINTRVKMTATVLIVFLLLWGLLLLLLLFFCRIGVRRPSDLNIMFPQNLGLSITDIENPFGGPPLKWASEEDIFFKHNWPTSFLFDFAIKEDILRVMLAEPYLSESCLVDSGAHIGDLSIPVAASLLHHGHLNQVVYAIEPSSFKCEFMRLIAKINKLDNVIVICAGLSDAQETLANDIITDDNTGGTTWANNILNSQAPLKLEDWRFDTSKKIKEAIIFQKLDHLREAGIINHRIAVLHLDVEGMEDAVIRGALKTLEKDLPYLSIEEHDGMKVIERFRHLPYKYLHRLNDNNCFSAR
jgi:FkbM family methyltransferase